MGNAARASAKEPTTAENDQTKQEEKHEKFYIDTLEKMKKPGCTFLKIGYVALSVITILKCIALIAVSVSTAIATKTFTIERSERLVCMVILAMTAGIAISVVIYAVMAVFRKKTKPLQTTGVVLITLVIIQVIICATSVNLTTDDEVNLSKTLLESFQLARDENPRHVKLWTVTQSDLTCCGVYGPEDYRVPSILYFPPDVPISCCPGFDPGRSELVQERERASCKARREYYTEGCSAPVVQLFNYTAFMVLSVSILTMLLEIIVAVLSAILSRKRSGCEQLPVEVSENPKAAS